MLVLVHLKSVCVCVFSKVCEEARCPNIGECWGGGEYNTATATIMVSVRAHCGIFCICIFLTVLEKTSCGLDNLGFLSLSLYVADGRHVYPGVQVLLCEDGPAASTSGPQRALQHSQGHRCLGTGLRGPHLRR